jgi:hypothetical protein
MVMRGWNDRAGGVNTPERLEPLNPEKKYLSHEDAKGELANPGYDCVARRPRIPGVTEIVGSTRAKSMEDMYNNIPDYLDFPDY